MKKIFFLAFLISHSSIAQNADPTLFRDTIEVQRHWYSSPVIKAVAVPTLLIGVGLATMGQHNEFPLSSHEVQKWRQRHYSTFTTDADNYMPSASLFIVGALDLTGIQHKHSWAGQIALFGLSNALNGFVTKEIKHKTNVLRPDGADRLSFPSAHTSSAFVAAEILHQEFKDQSPWISAAGYTLASSVGVLRVMNNRHWISDVVAGAGIGMLSVRATYYVAPLVYNKIFWRHRKSQHA